MVGTLAPVDQPPREPVTYIKELHGQLGPEGHLTTAHVTERIRTNRRLLGLLALLVVGLPIMTWAIPLPGAASIIIALGVGVGLSWLGYKAIGDVIERTFRE